MKLYSFSLVVLLASGLGMHAATFTYNNAAGGNWDNTTATGWATFPGGVTGSLPGGADTAIVNQNKSVTVNSNIDALSSPGSITVGNTNGGGFSAAVNVDSGGTISTGSVSISSGNDAGTLNVQGGTLNASGVINIGLAGNFNLASGTFTQNGSGARTITDGNSTGDGSVSISGGSFIANGAAANNILRLRTDVSVSGSGVLNMTGGQVIFDQDHTLSVMGSSVDINLDRLNYSAGTGSVSFVFDATGVSSVDSAAFIHLQNATIDIDGTAYTGGAGTYTLFSSTNLASLPVATPTVSGFAGFNTNVSQSGDDYVLSLTLIPEPNSAALLLSGAMLMFLRRKRHSA